MTRSCSTPENAPFRPPVERYLLSPASVLGVIIAMSSLGCHESVSGSDGDEPRSGGGARGTDVSPGGGTGGAEADGDTPALGTANSGATGVPAHPALECAEPDPWPLPSELTVVGDGSASSCTEAALRTAISSGGHVTFACGSEAVTIPISAEVETSDGLVLDGSGSDVTLDGGGITRILSAPNGTRLSVRSLRFIGGKAPESEDADGIGGAVAGNWRSEVEVRDCVFENNVAGRGGGAVSVWTGSSLTIVGSTFVGNRSYYGGAVYSLLSPLQVVNSSFVGNSTIDNGWGEGGAIGTDGASEYPDDELGGTIEICGSEFRDNVGLRSGGGVYLWVYPPDSIGIDRTLVRDNMVGEGGLGGGMRVSNGDISVRASSFVGNESDNHAGALYLDCAPSCTVVNTTFDGNAAGTYGGAISSGGVVNVNNVTFANNTAGGHGGALFGGDDFVVTNSLFVDNSSGNPWNQAHNCGSTYAGDHVLQWRSASGDAGGDACIEAPMTGDPLLEPEAGSEAQLPALLPGASSPALGTGAACELVDQRGAARPAEGCDLGAIEVP